MVQKSEAARAWETIAANQPLFSPKVGKYISWTLRATSAFSLLAWIILLALSLDLDGFFTHGSFAIPALWGFITALWARAFVKDALRPSTSGVCTAGYSVIWRILQAIICFICVVCFAVADEEGAVWMCIIGWFVNILGIMLLYSPQKQENRKRRRSAGMELLLLNSIEEASPAPPPEQKKRKFYLWLQVIGSFLAVLSMVDVLVRCSLSSLHPPRGREVMGAYQAQMYIECQGQGTPTILFETEVGTHSRMDYRKQFEAIQTETRVCWYDKEGYGRSQNSNRPKGHHQIVSTVQSSLSMLLANAGEKGPFIFVGHGIGGAVSRFFSMAEPSQVAGLLLLDASHEEMSGSLMDWVWPLVLHSVFAPLGVDIWLAPSAVSGVGSMDFDEEDMLNYANDRFWKAVASENYWWEDSAEALIALKQQIHGNSSDPLFGNLPISVLTAGQTCASYNPVSVPTKEMEGAVTSSDNTLVYINQTDLLCKNESGSLFDGFNGWLDLQRQLACESSDFFWEVYPSSGHFLTLQQPELVTKRIKELLVRSRAYLAAPK